MEGICVNIEDGKIHKDSIGWFRKQWAAMIRPLPTGRYFFPAPVRKDRRTHEQNAYLHHLFALIARGFQDRGYKEVKDGAIAKHIMKHRFLTTYMDMEGAESVPIVRDTRSLSKEEMSVFIEECIQFAAQHLHVTIPPPGQQTEIEQFKAA